MFILLIFDYKFTTILQWPNLHWQPYPLNPYGGPYASVPVPEPQHNFLAESAHCPPGHPFLTQSTYPHVPYHDPLDSQRGAIERPSSRSRSMPSGKTPKSTRGYSSARGRSKGKKKEQTTTLDSFGNPYPGALALPLSLSQPSRSIPRSGSSRKVNPYNKPEQALELQSFNNVIWDLAKRWFVLKLWRESCFFLKAEEKNATVDRCAMEAYEAAISEYSDAYESYPNAAALITKYRLQPQGTEALVKCREVVRGCYHNLNGFSLIRFILVTACCSFVSRNSSRSCSEGCG